ncbi:phosphoenolpyruvate synthase/pyruvate phosphate dikinase [Desulfomarina profundi]|uniref:Phosphoenolpyruvate synthase/pyruvate phosphate dikinase n=1 Tax=Desulfomarina profundi TaxID=2772557 RepID=A0A8D5FQ54_9BACT|nr:PEP/pyruvate-binding domain-containing protein [Desulfomarina profundi]BCL59381.1 phosphoenolpyruvate synthase/pyruvate phosphate dikinase [Desulfomarina profundi]
MAAETSISLKNTDGVIESDALKANLLETAGRVEIDSELLVLLEVVEDFKGLHSTLEKLLYEICHPFRNWRIILPQLRSFVLKNFKHYVSHAKGQDCLNLFADLFFDAILDTRRDSVLLTQAIGGLLVWVDKMIEATDIAGLEALGPVINRIFRRLAAYDTEDGPVMMHIVHGQYPVARIAKRLLQMVEIRHDSYDFLPLVELIRRVFRRCYTYWLQEDDPLDWFLTRCAIAEKDSRLTRLFIPISHETMKEHLAILEFLEVEGDGLAELKLLLELPAHVDIVKYYRSMPGKLAAAEDELRRLDGLGENHMPFFNENRKLLFLFKIMDTRGLYLIHEETLREINRSLVQLIRQQSFEEIEEFLLTTFKLLKANVKKYPHTSLQCIQVLGGEVFDRGNSRMVEAFLWGVVRFGFQHANVVGVDENWQPLSNPAHLANIRVWLHLIMREPKWCSTLFSALIMHLKLTGTCIKDTDLFQRDITELLNHPIEPIYNLAKQFTKLMPVFFNEIGSEGELRDVSTELDELHKRKDILIHFLRKQGHVESSNLIVDFIQAIFLFWKTKNKVVLSPYLPEEVYSQVKTSGRFIDNQHILSERFWREKKIREVEDILLEDETAIDEFLACQEDLDKKEVRRFALLVRMYKLLHRKYNLGFQQLRTELNRAANEGFPEIEQLLDELEHADTEQCLEALLSTLEGLKKIILSEEKFEAREDIYYKRHIAVDIPSVYGRYREKKFDALSLTFRLENLANLYLEKLPETVNLSIITQATFYNIVRCIKLYLQALEIDGITSRRLSTSLALLKNSLKVPRFSYTQYLDIFRGMSEGVKDIMYAFYTNIHQNNLSIIIPQIDPENLLNKYRNLYDEEDMTGTVQRVSELFFRELISSTFGLQHLDNFILRILQTLESQKDLLDEKKLDLLMTYNPDRGLSPLHDLNPFTNNLIHLGNKGFNLATLTVEKKPVPPAFVITTEIFRCREIVFGYSRTRGEFMKRIRNSLNEIEERAGKIFGSPEAPLLLSVRSGGAISMPGMMATVHNIGYNEELIEECIAQNGNAYLAWDNYRRFLQSWAMISGMKREDFQVLMDEAKARHNVTLKRHFSKEQMKELALSYQKLIRQRGIGIPDDPWLQLVNAIELVLDSWETHKAMEYRRIMDVSDSWGTAVIVQAMVFGNKSENAGSGVVFTAHPYRKVQRVALWGDYAYGDQGEDIVSGLVTSCAISIEQAELDGRSVEETLERRFPEIYKELLEISRDLVYNKRWNPQEIEFTFEGPEPENLYLLQTRDMITIKKKEHLNVFVETPELKKAHLGQGVGVSGSALSGLAVFTEENIRELRENNPEVPLILIRQDTVPEDIKVVSLADGLLTSRGGQTSHASVVAVRLGKTCVVGCRSLQVYEVEQYCEIAGLKIRFGDPISIDGRTGQVLEGMHRAVEEYHILPI